MGHGTPLGLNINEDRPMVRDLSAADQSVADTLAAADQQFRQARMFQGPGVDTQTEVSSFSAYLQPSDTSTITGVDQVWPKKIIDDITPDDSVSEVGGHVPGAASSSKDIREQPATVKASESPVPPPPPRDMQPLPPSNRPSFNLVIEQRARQIVYGHMEDHPSAHILAIKVTETEDMDEAMLEATVMLNKKVLKNRINQAWDSRAVIGFLVRAVEVTQEIITVGWRDVNIAEGFITAAKLTAIARLARDENEQLAKDKFRHTMIVNSSGDLITAPTAMINVVRQKILSQDA